MGASAGGGTAPAPHPRPASKDGMPALRFRFSGDSRFLPGAALRSRPAARLRALAAPAFPLAAWLRAASLCAVLLCAAVLRAAVLCAVFPRAVFLRAGSLSAAVLCAAVLCAGLLCTPGRAAADGSTSFGTADAPLTAFWTNGQLLVSVRPAPNEGYIQIARRLLENPERHAELARFNDNRSVLTGVAVKVPLALLKPELRGAALRAMYPDDEIAEDGWAHTVTDPLENLIQLTEAFTGSKRHFKELGKRNGLRNPNLLPLGTQIVIPLEWIPEAMGFRPAGLKPPLRLETDAATGRAYALYAIEADETLYSILIRFTDRERADEINRLSGILVRLNNLKGAKRIRPGKALRIPLEWISDDYLIGRPGAAAPAVAAASAPPGPAPEPAAPAAPAPAKSAPESAKPAKDTAKPVPESAKPATGTAKAPPESARRAPAPGKPAARRAPKSPVPGLVPVHVILDPGHGGVDPGAVYGSRRQGDRVYEHEVVFDIALRLTQLLEARGNKVYPLVRDPQQAQPVEALSAKRFGQEQLATTPPYPMNSVHVAVNLRVYLVDAIYQRLIRQGVPPEQIVLVSIHGDALAPTLRGAMIYYPDFRLRTPEFRPQGRAYRARTEARAHLIRFADRDNRSAQDASRGLAELVLHQLDAQQVRISRRKSLRSFYYRDGVRTLPAVLRYSRVPHSILVEVANLNNPEDRQELLRGGARQRIAQGLAAAVDAYRLRQAQIARREE